MKKRLDGLSLSFAIPQLLWLSGHSRDSRDATMTTLEELVTHYYVTPVKRLQSLDIIVDKDAC